MTSETNEATPSPREGANQDPGNAIGTNPFATPVARGSITSDAVHHHAYTPPDAVAEGKGTH